MAKELAVQRVSPWSQAPPFGTGSWRFVCGGGARKALPAATSTALALEVAPPFVMRSPTGCHPLVGLVQVLGHAKKSSARRRA